MNETFYPPQEPQLQVSGGSKKKFLKIAGLVFLIWLCILSAGYILGWRASNAQDMVSAKPKSNSLKVLRSENALFKKRCQSLQPKGPYIIIDTADNVLYLKEGIKTSLKATVSAGSGSLLVEPSGTRRWIFDTPRGEFTIKSKFVKPAWVKPDWAFIEEGKPIPKNPKDRVELGMLGDYALGFGDGYFIHGTLYTRLLGKNITHGCVRVGDDDLKILYQATPLGTKVLIF
jgi:lipoprotein-anchoring transpeptidase ErfK/SrfK